MRLAMVALGGLLLLGCSGREPARTPAGDGVVGMLAEVSDVRPGLPVMVFVYTDG